MIIVIMIIIIIIVILIVTIIITIIILFIQFNKSFQGKSTGNHVLSQQIWVPCVPLNQSIEALQATEPPPFLTLELHAWPLKLGQDLRHCIRALKTSRAEKILSMLEAPGHRDVSRCLFHVCSQALLDVSFYGKSEVKMDGSIGTEFVDIFFLHIENG